MCGLKLVVLFLTIIQYAPAERPNVILIIADDLGWNDVGFHGSEIPTPNIDALAYSGVILNRHYTATTCSPSRAALLTGKYHSRLGMQGTPILPSVKAGLDPKEKIMPQYFKELGYSTHLLGKWHLGYYTPKHLPTNRGFDTFFGYHNGFIGYYDGTHPFWNASGMDVWRNTKKSWQEFFGKYLTTLITDEAVKVINSHANNTGKDGLFMIVSSPAPHRGSRKLDLEPPPFSFGERTKNISDVKRKVFADVTLGLDNSVGDVITALKENQMIDNSIIVFFSDNGGSTVDEVWNFNNYASNWPLRGEKQSNHEGAVRTVSTVWSSLFSSSAKSTILNGHFHITDWLPTLYTAVGGNIEELKDIDGIDQWESLKTGEDKHLRQELLLDLDDGNNVEAVIKGNWKLIKNFSKKLKLSSTDKYFGVNLRGIMEYNKTEIYTSKVARSLIDTHLKDSIVDQLRAEGTITEMCDPQQQAKSMATDCHSKYCLYNIEEDPCECFDLAASNMDIVQELTSILDNHRQRLVKKLDFSLDRRGLPDVTNYWEPWIESFSPINYVNIKLIILLLCLICYL